MLLGSDDEIGFPAFLAPLAAKTGLTVASGLATKVAGGILSKVTGGGKAPPPPRCSFVQRLSKVFGSRPNCAG